MTEKYQEDGVSFTEEYQFKVSTHPVILPISSALIKAHKERNTENSSEKEYEQDVYENFFGNLNEASKKFYELGGDALEEWEVVQDGIQMVSSILFQFNPTLDTKYDRSETYAQINSFFWGTYFYLHGVSGAERAGQSDELSAWKMARHFAEEYWKFGQEEFPWVFQQGVDYVEANIQSYKEPEEKLNVLGKLLERFRFSEQEQNGFMFFLGGSILVSRSESDIERLQIAREQITKFDINEEYEELLGPLRDIHIQHFFEEFVWRMGTELQPRKVKVEGLDIEVSEFEFKNYQYLEEADTKIETYFQREYYLNKMLIGIGEELTSNGYDLRNSFKAGVCFFNLKAQTDANCTFKLTQEINNALTPIADFITMVARSTTDVFDGYLDIQIALYTAIRGQSEEFSKTLWGFQSYIFFEDQEEIPGIHAMDINEFKNHCREKVIRFLSSVDPEPLLKIAAKQEHISMFPPIKSSIDERESFDAAFQDAFGHINQTSNYQSDMNAKSLLIYSYFCVICETVLMQYENKTLQ